MSEVAYAEFLSQVESAVGIEDRLVTLEAEVERADLTEHERDNLLGRIDRYRENFDDMRGARLVEAVEQTLDKPVRDDAIPDFDLTYDGAGAVGVED